MRSRMLVTVLALGCGVALAGTGEQGQRQGRGQGTEMFQGGVYDNGKLQDDWFYDSYSNKKGFGADYLQTSNYYGVFDDRADADDWFFDRYEIVGQRETPGRQEEGPTQRGSQGAQGRNQGQQGRQGEQSGQQGRQGEQSGQQGRQGEQSGQQGQQSGQQGRQGEQSGQQGRQPSRLGHGGEIGEGGNVSDQGGRLGEQFGQRGEGAQQIQGRVEAVKEVETPSSVHQVVLLSKGDDRWVVDLGPTRGLSDLDINEGDNLQVQGEIGRVGDRAVLFASNVTYKDQQFPVRQDLKLESSRAPLEPARQQSFSGEILRLKQVNVEGRGGVHAVALVSLQDGREIPVDLGPADQFDKLNLGEGDTISGTGQTLPIGEHLVIWANQLQVKGKQIDLRGNQQGGPVRGTH